MKNITLSNYEVEELEIDDDVTITEFNIADRFPTSYMEAIETYRFDETIEIFGFEDVKLAVHSVFNRSDNESYRNNMISGVLSMLTVLYADWDLG